MRMKVYWLIGLLSGLSVWASVPPEHWPLDAATVGSVKTNSGIEIESGTRFTLHRIEEGQVLGTFGRKGTYWIDVEKTNVTTLADQIARGDLDKNGPNLVERLYNTLYLRNKEGVNKPIRFTDLSDKKYLLFYFAYGADEAHGTFISELSQQYAAIRHGLPSLELIMIQCDALVFKNADPGSISWPFMAVHMSHAYKDAMHLGQAQSASSFVLTGSNGNVIQRFQPNATLDEIKAALSALR